MSRIETERRVVCADGRHAFPGKYSSLEAKVRAYDKGGCWGDCGPHRIQVRTVTVGEWEDEGVDMSTPEAAWPEELIEAIAELEPLLHRHIRALNGPTAGKPPAECYVAAAKLLDAAVAWRDPETGKPELFRREPLGEYVRWLESERARLAALVEADDPGTCPGCGRDWGEPSKLESRLPFPTFEAEDWHAAIAERNAVEAERDALRALVRKFVAWGDAPTDDYSDLMSEAAALAGVDHGE